MNMQASIFHYLERHFVAENLVEINTAHNGVAYVQK